MTHELFECLGQDFFFLLAGLGVDGGGLVFGLAAGDGFLGFGTLRGRFARDLASLCISHFDHTE